MRLEDLDFRLPPGLIAQEPPAERSAGRLLVLDRVSGDHTHRRVLDLPDLLRPGDLLIANDTRVLAARVHATRDTGGRVEVLFLESCMPAADRAAPLDGQIGPSWHALLKAGGRPAPGECLRVGPSAAIRLVAREADGSWIVATEGATPAALMAAYGRMPLPPYIRRAPSDPRAALDEARYQTVFARVDGAVAAPTAGLHLTPALLAACTARDIEQAYVTLHVGRGTFEPVRVEELDAHPMHAERFEIPAATRAAIERTRSRGGRVVAVGTTSVRALEAASRGTPDGLPRVGAASTDLLIQPGFEFCVVDVLLTNFHLPKSTLLALVYALAGRDPVRAAYDAAIEASYRFFSYGDAMLIG